jgi:hypothetical protein
MTKRALLLAVPLGMVAAAVLLLLTRPGSAQGTGQASAAQMDGFKAPVDVDTAGLPGPVQPLFYRHDVHAGEYEMDCRYCHFAAEVSPSAGLPTMSTCMGCHILAGAANPEVQKLRDYWNERRPIEWVEVHRLAPFVRFPHHRHVNSDAEIECQDCHGPIEEMPQVYQYASLKMGWCITCHEKEEASTDCTVCHY